MTKFNVAASGPFLELTVSLKGIAKLYGGDWCDRINFRTCSSLLVIMCAISTSYEYLGKSNIQCWMPAQFKKSWEKYSENYCYVEGTYSVGFDEQFPMNATEKEGRVLLYYQWVPWILFGQALFFVLGTMSWALAGYGDMPSMDRHLGKSAYKSDQMVCMEGPTDEVVEGWMQMKQMRKAKGEDGNQYRITFYYMLLKFYHLANCIGQLLLLNYFLDPHDTYGFFYGFGIAGDLINGRRWTESAHFPRVTFCDVSVKDVGDLLVNYTFQCVLPLNMFNEKIFIFVWGCVFCVALLNIANIVEWFFYIFGKENNLRFIEMRLVSQRLSIHNFKKPIDPKTYFANDHVVQDFIDRALTTDTITTLRLIKKNLGEVVCSDLVIKMCNAWTKSEVPQLHKRPGVKNQYEKSIDISENEKDAGSFDGQSTEESEISGPTVQVGNEENVPQFNTIGSRDYTYFDG